MQLDNQVNLLMCLMLVKVELEHLAKNSVQVPLVSLWLEAQECQLIPIVAWDHMAQWLEVLEINSHRTDHPDGCPLRSRLVARLMVRLAAVVATVMEMIRWTEAGRHMEVGYLLLDTELLLHLLILVLEG